MVAIAQFVYISMFPELYECFLLQFALALLGFQPKALRYLLTELATPLGITILLFLVWVIQCQSGLSSQFACYHYIACSCKNSDFKSDFFHQASFLFFLVKFYIRTFVSLQKCIQACFSELKSHIRGFLLAETRVHVAVQRHNCIYICFA